MKKIQRFIIPCLLVLLVIISYVNSINNGFVSDDIAGIVREGPSWTWRSVFTNIIFLTRWGSILQFFLYQLVGPSPWAYRLVNIVSHALSVLLVYTIVFQLFRPSRVNQWIRVEAGQSKLLSFYASHPLFLAFFSAALFAVHPIIVESVTWISGGVYVQYGMVFLFSFLLYMNSGQTKTGKNRSLYRIWSYMIYVFSLCFTEKAMVLFLFFILYEWCYGNLRRNWRKLMPYFIVSSIFILFYLTKLNIRTTSVAQMFGGGGQIFNNPFIQVPAAITSYWALILWPQNLTLYHANPVMTSFNYGLRFIMFLGYGAAILITFLKNRKLCFWFFWFLIPLLPTISPITVSWYVAERYAYLSVIGIFVLIAYGFEWVFTHMKSIITSQHRDVTNEQKSYTKIRAFLYLYTAFWILIISLLMVRTIIRNRDWQNEDTLWIATAQTSPLVPYTWNNMGDVYSRQGDLKKAAEMFERAIIINPMYAAAYHNLAETKRGMGDIGDAILLYQKALEINPNLWETHASLAAIYMNKKDFRQALFHIEEALHIVPDNPMLLRAHNQLRQIQE